MYTHRERASAQRGAKRQVDIVSVYNATENQTPHRMLHDAAGTTHQRVLVLVPRQAIAALHQHLKPKFEVLLKPVTRGFKLALADRTYHLRKHGHLVHGAREPHDGGHAQAECL